MIEDNEVPLWQQKHRDATARRRGTGPVDPETVTRIVVIDHRWEALNPGVALELRDVHVELDYQDDGRTLKVWIT